MHEERSEGKRREGTDLVDLTVLLDVAALNRLELEVASNLRMQKHLDELAWKETEGTFR